VFCSGPQTDGGGSWNLAGAAGHVTIRLGGGGSSAGNPAGERRTFNEKVPAVARCTSADTVAAQPARSGGLALGRRAGARMGPPPRAGHRVSRDNATRCSGDLPEFPRTARSRSWRGRLRENGAAIPETTDPDRHGHAPARLTCWEDRQARRLSPVAEEHPGVQVICRDRAASIAEVPRGAPDRHPGADRFPKWENLCDAVEKRPSSRCRAELQH